LYKLEEKKKELKKKLEEENNKWKRKAVKEELKRISSDIKAVKKEIETLKSSESDSATRQQTAGGNKSVRGFLEERRKSWRVLRAVLTFPLLGKFFIRDFSPLRPVLVEGKWERVVKRRVPVPGAGAMGGSKKPPAGALSYSERAEYKYPSQNCTNVQFC